MWLFVKKLIFQFSKMHHYLATLLLLHTIPQAVLIRYEWGQVTFTTSHKVNIQSALASRFLRVQRWGKISRFSLFENCQFCQFKKRHKGVFQKRFQRLYIMYKMGLYHTAFSFFLIWLCMGTISPQISVKFHFF